MRNGFRHLNPLATIVLLASCATPSTTPDTLNAAYQQSIAEAAVKQPDYVRPLQAIDPTKPTVTVVTVQPSSTIDTKDFVWVTQPDALRALCAGKPDPLLAMQRALGLPPDKRPDVNVFTFDVKPADIFRPCASSPDISTTQCAVDLPAQPDPARATTEHFLLKQIMDSYRTGFKDPGYPFTAMGWTYDWDPDSKTHQGVSEYVVKPGAVIANVVSSDPAAFCEGQ